MLRSILEMIIYKMLTMILKTIVTVMEIIITIIEIKIGLTPAYEPIYLLMLQFLFLLIYTLYRYFC